MIGRTLSHYRIVDKLGGGGMGEVYLAEDTKLKRKVAIKVLPPELASEPQQLKRFQREAESLAALDHPNIVTVYSVEEADGVHFLTMGLVEGRTLERLIPAEGMRLEEFFAVAVPIADALAAAHDRGIVHRDLKPQNIMVDDEGRAKVLDFGIATLRQREAALESQIADTKATRTPTEGLTEKGLFLGTLPYTSPEQIQGKPADASSDVFSLGIVLHQMATGVHPFRGETAADIASSILRDTPRSVNEKRASLPRHLGRIVMQCLEKEQRRRFQTAVEVKNQLEHLQEELTAERILEQKGGLERGTPDSAAVGKAAPQDERPVARPLAASWQTDSSSAVRAAAFAALAIVVLGAILVGFDVGGFRGRFLGGGASAPIESIAVIPLTNLTGDPDQEYFVDGMTEALITDLAKISALRVTSRTSVFLYKETDKSLPEIAEDLGVDAVVEGSVLRDGNRVRVTAQLIDARDDRHLWAEDYEREIEDVLSLQREVARAIAEEIDVQLTISEAERLADTRPVDPEAYDAYLQGRFHWYRFLPGDADRAAEYFEWALEKDPDFALAYTGLADVWGFRGYWGFLPPSLVNPKLSDLSHRALEIDPNLARAHSTAGKIKLHVEWDWAGAVAAYDRALELSPNDAVLHRENSLLLIQLGRREEALAKALRSVELDPLSLFSEMVLGWVLWNQDQDRAAEATERLRRAGPLLPAKLALWSIYAHAGQHEAALAEAADYYRFVADSEVVQAFEEGWLGVIAESGPPAAYAEAMMVGARALEAQVGERYLQPTQLARLYMHAGDSDGAFQWLERAFEEHDFHLVTLQMAEWASLRSDPRFEDLVQRIGFPEE